MNLTLAAQAKKISSLSNLMNCSVVLTEKQIKKKFTLCKILKMIMTI